MWQQAELVLINYIPDEITLGMFFLKEVGENKELFINTKKEVETDNFIEKYGFPVKLFIETELDNDMQISEELYLNSVFDSEKLEYYNTTSLKELNTILNKYEGMLEIMINVEYTNYFKLPDNKFIIRYLTE